MKLKSKNRLYQGISFVLVACLFLGLFTGSITGHAAPRQSTTWGFFGGNTPHAPFALRNSDTGEILGTFCMAINVFGLSTSYQRIDQSTAQSTLGLSPAAIAEIRHAVAIMRTMYVGGAISHEFAAMRMPAASLNRRLGPNLTQDLIWYRQFMDNPTRYPSPATRGTTPFSAIEQAFFFGTGNPTLNPGDTLDVVINQPYSLDANEHGLIGPFTVNWAPGSAPSLISINGTPRFSFVERELAAIAVMENDLPSVVRDVALGEQFYIVPRASGTLTVTLRSNSTIVTGFEEYFLVHGATQPQYGIDFDIWGGMTFTFESDAVSEVLIKEVMQYGTTNAWSSHIYMTPGSQGLFRVTVDGEKIGYSGIDLMFSPHDEEWRLAQNPIPIWTPEQLDAVRYHMDRNYILMNNLCMQNFVADSQWQTWIPLGIDPIDGEPTQHFTGTFDGNGFTISGLTIRGRSVNRYGLFSYLGEGSTVQNLGIRDFEIDSVLVAGGLAGSASWANIYNVHAQNIRLTGNASVGGIIGLGLNSVVSNSTARHIYISAHGNASGLGDNISLRAQSGKGGLVGSNVQTDGRIYNSHVYDVTINRFQFFGPTNSSRHTSSGAGGIAGLATNITNSTASRINIVDARIANASQGPFAGGIAGRARYVSDSRASQVNIRGMNGFSLIAGGIIGRSLAHGGTITNSTVSGLNITSSSGTTWAGGIVGCNWGTVSSIIVSSSVYSLNITASSSLLAGGITGNTNSRCQIFDVYASGTIRFSGTSGHDIGGIAGNASALALVENAISEVNIVVGETGTMTSNQRVGGITGMRMSPDTSGITVRNSVAAGSITINPRVSGTVGRIGGFIANIVYTENNIAYENMTTGPFVTPLMLSLTDTYDFGMHIPEPYYTATYYAETYYNPIDNNIDFDFTPVITTTTGAAMSAIIEIVPTSSDPNGLHGRSVTAAQLRQQSTFEDLNFDFNTMWRPPAGNNLPRLRTYGPSNPSIIGSTIAIADPNPAANDGVWARGARTFWVIDNFDGTRLTNADLLVQDGSQRVPMGSASETIVVHVSANERFMFYYLTAQLNQEREFTNTVSMGLLNDSATITVSDEPDVYFYVGVEKFGTSILTPIETGWTFTLRRGDEVITTFTHATQQFLLTTPGIYTLVETVAPNGFYLDPTEFTFEFTGTAIIFDENATHTSGFFSLSGAGTERTLILTSINQPITDPDPQFTLTFHLYLNTALYNHQQLYNRFEGYMNGYDPDSLHLTLTVPVNPGTAMSTWGPLIDTALSIGHIFGVPGSPGHAFWGWFTDETLENSGRTNISSDLRRPALANRCEVLALISDIENANTDALKIALFGSATGGNIDLFSIWSLWGDVNDDDVVCQEDLNLLTLFIMLTVPGITVIELNEVAANVVIDDVICQLDLNLLTLYVMLSVPGIMEVVLGVQP